MRKTDVQTASDREIMMQTCVRAEGRDLSECGNDSSGMADAQWWRSSVVYQIYPKSFADSDGDGVGDLRGVIGKLDYLQWLGVNVIWLSPFFVSPMVDNGYDIADYYHVDPLFGTNEDFDELVRQAHARGIRVLCDLVINHCSDQHEWFKKACNDPFSDEHGYFIIRHKNQLNNWRSVFGGSVWEPMPGNPDEYYMHVFAKEQPDLNWENPRLRHELYRMINYWLDHGVDGFRVDAITYIKKDQRFESFPADGPDGLVGVAVGSSNQPGIGAFLTEMRQEVFDRRGCLTVAEASDVPYEQLRDYAGPDGFFSMIFEFHYQDPYVDPDNLAWYAVRPWSVEEWKALVFKAQREQQRLGVWSPTHLECHDSARSISRLLPEATYESVTMLATLFFLLRGTPFIYQGQELGMGNATIDDIDQFDDVFTHDQYRVALEAGLSEQDAFRVVSFRSRDNARTPMQWTPGEHAGFTEGQPWLPINRDWQKTNVEVESDDDTSVLWYYKRLIALRMDPRWSSSLSEGLCTPVFEQKENVVAYDRVGADGSVVRVLCNFQHESVSVSLDDKIRVLLSNVGREGTLSGDTLMLEPYEAIVLA
ncbi:alpha-glucosidase [Bifidobacterium phasiani]|uniref:Alpha-glucosidase n=1 Tax=Bifidobacterium phasiani TaxID=2834431 RepID=A0ABS6W6N4_9BIFI|nr:alpha-glucosidase [Bifidobacterium phasiani]MBW3082153.1 alpha-glucosidase [Bifidobacterium phasiani]